jgi:hypothetical protein
MAVGLSDVGYWGYSGSRILMPLLRLNGHAVNRDNMCRVQKRFSVAELFLLMPLVLSVFDPPCPSLKLEVF